MLTGNSPHPNSRLRGRSPVGKDRARISPPAPTASTTSVSPPRPPRVRRRRRRVLLLAITALTLLFLFLFSPTHDFLGLPPALQGLRRVSPASIAALMRPRVDEIHGLLYYALQENEALADDLPDPTRPIDLSVYADGDPAPNWPARVKLLNEATPLIVFSKTYCLYSRKAKDILARYDLTPPPKIIEVDLRDDGDFIKAVLTRLTGRATFPNVILRGKSIGGADDIIAMHRDGHLRQVFEKAGLKVRGELRGEDAT